MTRLHLLLCAAFALIPLTTIACGPEPRPKAGPDYDAVRDRANASHDSLNHEESKAH